MSVVLVNSCTVFFYPFIPALLNVVTVSCRLLSAVWVLFELCLVIWYAFLALYYLSVTYLAFSHSWIRHFCLFYSFTLDFACVRCHFLLVSFRLLPIRPLWSYCFHFHCFAYHPPLSRPSVFCDLSFLRRFWCLFSSPGFLPRLHVVEHCTTLRRHFRIFPLCPLLGLSVSAIVFIVPANISNFLTSMMFIICKVANSVYSFPSSEILSRIYSLTTLIPRRDQLGKHSSAPFQSFPLAHNE